MEVKEKIIRALKKLIEKDAGLLQRDVNERSITHRLAIYIEEEFQEFDIREFDINVDCEYNRKGTIPKRLMNFKKPVDSDDTNGATVFPDIIVHRRGTKDNFIVIEAKKGDVKCERDQGNCKCDRCKLLAYKSELRYKHAFFIKFPVGNAFNEREEQDFDNWVEEVKQ